MMRLTSMRVAAAAALAVAVAGAVLVWPVARVQGAGPAAKTLSYDKEGNYIVPRDYREWVFLSSGLDMIYGPKAATLSGHSMFNNVFVDPASYRSYLANGTWPDQTVMILEIRGAESHVSINQGGRSQGGEIMGMEVHLKDTSRYSGDWAFFDVNAAGTGKLIPQPASCYTCHREHGAVDTSFVQFYPTLLPIAKAKGTLSPAYVKEEAAVPQAAK